MKLAKSSFAALVALTFTTGAALATYHGPKPAMTGKIGEETFLMDANKMTLYTFDKDTKGVSNCKGGCADLWPPLLVDAGTDLSKPYSVIQRDDGTMQVAYKGMPLYLWVKDSKPGDMTGDGVKGVWHTARP